MYSVCHVRHLISRFSAADTTDIRPYQHGIVAWRKRITVNECNHGQSKVYSSSQSCGNGNESGGCCTDVKNGDCCETKGNNASCCSSSTNAGGGATVNLNELLCYSCQVHLKDYKDDAIENLPPNVAQSAYEKTCEERLHSQIKDFLLSDGEE